MIALVHETPALWCFFVSYVWRAASDASFALVPKARRRSLANPSHLLLSQQLAAHSTFAGHIIKRAPRQSPPLRHCSLSNKTVGNFEGERSRCSATPLTWRYQRLSLATGPSTGTRKGWCHPISVWQRSKQKPRPHLVQIDLCFKVKKERQGTRKQAEDEQKGVMISESTGLALFSHTERSLTHWAIHDPTTYQTRNLDIFVRRIVKKETECKT